MAPSQTTLDQGKVQEFFGKVVQDVAATLHAGLVLIGDKLGLYRAMAGAGPLTPADLAKRTGTRERYVREWLSAQAAGGYVTYDPATGASRCRPSTRSCCSMPMCRARSSSAWARSATSRRSPTGSGPARASAGTSTTPGCTRDASASSVRATP